MNISFRRTLFFAGAFITVTGAFAQKISTDTLFLSRKGNGIQTQTLYSDSLVSSFCIIIPEKVKAHRHDFHTEQVIVLEGEGVMTMGDKKFTIHKDDMIFIPKGQVHSVVVTKAPLKVISNQTPYFDGKDRIIAE